jgi:hypothetical protein
VSAPRPRFYFVYISSDGVKRRTTSNPSPRFIERPHFLANASNAAPHSGGGAASSCVTSCVARFENVVLLFVSQRDRRINARLPVARRKSLSLEEQLNHSSVRSTWQSATLNEAQESDRLCPLMQISLPRPCV